MALTPYEIQTLDELYHRRLLHREADEVLYGYATMKQRVEQLGMAIPPTMRRFLVPLDWCRVVVETISARQQVRSMVLPGEETADQTLQKISDANNLPALMDMWRRDYLTFGRGFVSVGSNERGPYPLMRVESPREMEALVDLRQESMIAAARFYGSDEVDAGPKHATLYLPDRTKWLTKEGGRWSEVAVDNHDLGAVPIIMHLNRRWSGSFEGESELTGVIPLVDASIRSLTNMQFAQEAHGVPGIWATGVTQKDFVDNDGKPLSQFEAYYDVIKVLTDADAKWGQFNAADLKNFETAMRIYGTQAAITTGFPARMFGITTANPSSEGAVVSDEIQLVRGVERKNVAEGVSLGWLGGLAWRFHTGEWIEGNQIRVDHFDPSTPTVAQREDALSKRRASGVLSREGYWDELGWSEARKAKEREYLRQEAADPELQVALELLNRDAGRVPNLPG